MKRAWFYGGITLLIVCFLLMSFPPGGRAQTESEPHPDWVEILTTLHRELGDSEKIIKRQLYNAQRQPGTPPFSAVYPAEEGQVARLNLVVEGEMVWFSEASATVPQVDVQVPTGETPLTGDQTLTWQASDRSNLVTDFMLCWFQVSST